MVTNDIILLPSILLTKTYYILCEETVYTYDKDDDNNNEDLSETGRKRKQQLLFFFSCFYLTNVNMISVTIEVDKCVKRLTFLLI
jgi:hypothetical protein